MWVGSIPVAILLCYQDYCIIITLICLLLGSKNKKHLKVSTQATIHPLAIVLTMALVSLIAEGSIVALILSSLCFL